MPVLRLGALAVASVVLFLWCAFAAAAENNDSWTTSQAVQIITFVLFVLGVLSFCGIVGVQLAQRRARRRQTQR